VSKFLVTLGDPSGIGPEICAKLFRSVKQKNLILFAGRKKYLKPYLSGKELSAIDVAEPSGPAPRVNPGRPSPLSGREASLFLDAAVNLLRLRAASALVTAPVSKEMISLCGKKFTGHTEYLSSHFGHRKVIMLFVTEKFTVLLLTRHIPLERVPNTQSSGNLYGQIGAAAAAVSAVKNILPEKLRLLICALNPHAGEGGGTGTEEKRILAPLAEKLKKNFDVRGPIPADEVFYEASRGACDLVVSLYHDQALIPLRLLTGRRAVNLTWGLPFVRTSPLHGTAFDIAGKNKADASSMTEAIKLAGDTMLVSI